MRRKFSSGLFLLVLALFPARSLPAQGTRQKAGPYAIVAGTVLRDPGFTQPGASVVLALKNATNRKLQLQIR